MTPDVNIKKENIKISDQKLFQLINEQLLFVAFLSEIDKYCWEKMYQEFDSYSEMLCLSKNFNCFPNVDNEKYVL